MAQTLSQVSLQEIRHVASPLLKDVGTSSAASVDGGGDVDETWRIEAPRDRMCNHLAVAILGFISLCSLCCMIGGGVLLNSIASLPFAHCRILYAVGAASVVAGCVFIPGVAVVSVRLYRKKELSQYGACLFPSDQSRATKARRVIVTGVIPLVVGLAALGLTIGSIALFTLSTTVAPLEKDYKNIAGIDGPVTISRDAAGLTHIAASSRADALFGQGFAQAQDRLWQLEFNRLAARGRLAEFVGDAALTFDKQTRTLNMVNAGALLCQSITPDQRVLLQAFVNGINLYLDQVNERPPEFLFMSKRLLYFHEPEPFTVDDVCLSARLLQWQLSFNINLEVMRFKMFWKTNRTYDEVEEMFVNMTNISHTIFTPQQLDISEADAVAARAREAEDHVIERALYESYMTSLKTMYGGGTDDASDEHDDTTTSSSLGYLMGDWMAGLDFFEWKAQHASNAWAGRAAGAGTKACGASDPHLNINIPSVWYYSHLTYPTSTTDNTSFDTSGVGMLGVPGCHIGKTTHVAWGITMSLTDLEDLYLLVPDPANPDTHYLVNGTSLAFVPRTEVIKVKGSDTLTLQVQDSIYGPVATDILKLPKALKFAVWAKPLLPDNTSMTGVLNLGDPSVRTVRDLRDMGFGQFQSPGFSIPMQDEAGNVGYTMTGWHVLRPPGHTGKYPTLGNGSFDIVRPIPFSELPTIIMNASMASVNGQPMMISAANQKIYPDGYRYTLGYDYVYPYRGGRIQDLLASDTSALSSFEFHRSVQTDLHSNVFVELKNAMGNNSAFQGALTAGGQQWMSSMVSQWDGRSTKGSGYPSFLFLWVRRLSAIPADVIKALKLDFWSPMYRYPYALLTNPTATMLRQCAALSATTAGTGAGAPSMDSCALFAADAFNDLAAQYPTPADAPKWGFDLNTLTATNLMMHGTILECMFERSVPKDGDYSSIDVSDFASTLQDSMSPKAASSMRQLYDWSTPGNVSFIFPGGDSGNPYSPRYQNLLAPFGDDMYVTVTVEGPPSGAEVTTSQSLHP